MSYWTLELASYLSDAPFPANKNELIDYAIRTGAPLEVIENLQSLEDEIELDPIMDRLDNYQKLKRKLEQKNWKKPSCCIEVG